MRFLWDLKREQGEGNQEVGDDEQWSVGVGVDWSKTRVILEKVWAGLCYWIRVGLG